MHSPTSSCYVVLNAPRHPPPEFLMFYLQEFIPQGKTSIARRFVKGKKNVSDFRGAEKILLIRLLSPCVEAHIAG